MKSRCEYGSRFSSQYSTCCRRLLFVSRTCCRRLFTAICVMYREQVLPQLDLPEVGEELEERVLDQVVHVGVGKVVSPAGTPHDLDGVLVQIVGDGTSPLGLTDGRSELIGIDGQ
jgi:hypothetical protein